GMPVMIRTNSATELCITRGQEGWVYGWQAEVGSRGQNVLGVLFVKLANPPQSVKFDGLPENVVPLLRTSTTTLCNLPDDSTISVTRSQVEVLPNFAMTDYASQGKTRAYNVVDLNNCYLHQSYYTALSRSASAAGTIILQGFDAKKITGGASGALRQEFRELEFLDEITRLTYEGNLHPSVTGDRRNTLIATYRLLKGETYFPTMIHGALRWSKSDPYLGADLPPIPSRIPKRRVSESAEQNKHSKKIKPEPAFQKKRHEIAQHSMPLGTKWEANSCAYDAVVTILYNVWRDDTIVWTERFNALNMELLGVLSTGFQNHMSGRYTLENVRDYFRRALHRSAEGRFIWGQFASVHSIVEYALRAREPIISSELRCPNGHTMDRNTIVLLNSCLINAVVTHQNRDNNGGFRVITSSKCTACDGNLYRQSSYVRAPPLLAFDVAECGPGYVVEDRVLVAVDNHSWSYNLRGVIYYGHAHFTARIVTTDGVVWYYDGI
ncbi:hypothetical protein BD779DRAFT_1386038, partial [Infundibulicybe gibba]